MSKRGFGLVLLIFRDRGSRGLLKAYCQADLFLACRHTKTASIKAWAEASTLLQQQRGLTLFRCRLVAFHRWTRADEMPVAVEVVHPVDGAPIFVAQQSFDREARQCACIRAIPVFIGEIENGMRCILEDIVFANAPHTVFDLTDENWD